MQTNDLKSPASSNDLGQEGTNEAEAGRHVIDHGQADSGGDARFMQSRNTLRNQKRCVSKDQLWCAESYAVLGTSLQCRTNRVISGMFNVESLGMVDRKEGALEVVKYHKASIRSLINTLNVTSVPVKRINNDARMIFNRVFVYARQWS